MLEVITNHLGAVQFEISAGRHRVYSDQPVENGGFDEGMTPPELMLASLGACAGYYAVDYLKRSKVPAEGVRVRTTAEKVQGPPRLDDIHIELPVTLTEAVLGAQIRAPTPKGPVVLTVPKGSNTGNVLRLKGRGVPRRDGHGDEFVTLKVMLPPAPDPELEAFLSKWTPGTSYDPRREMLS